MLLKLNYNLNLCRLNALIAEIMKFVILHGYIIIMIIKCDIKNAYKS